MRTLGGALLAAAAFLAVLFAGARLTDALDAPDAAWVAVCALGGFAGGFAGAAVARTYVVVAGPGLLALLFALTTNAADPLGPWYALLASVAAAAAGVLAQRRR